ncbi:MAG TPA: hypothetical protein PK280_16970 [Planctomycetota bacterium]|nr:hypothetical protein [Planctomycetota bacterium]
MAEIDKLERLARLAREEASPDLPDDMAEKAMLRVRAAGRPRPAAPALRWRLVAAAACAAVLALAAALAWPEHRPARSPAGDEDRTPTINVAADRDVMVPPLEILESLETEVNQLMGSVDSRRAPAART